MKDRQLVLVVKAVVALLLLVAPCAAEVRPAAAIPGAPCTATIAACDACHGSPESPAPPTDLEGNTWTSAAGVGAHQAHLQAPSKLSPPIACEACHVVP